MILPKATSAYPTSSKQTHRLGIFMRQRLLPPLITTGLAVVNIIALLSCAGVSTSNGDSGGGGIPGGGGGGGTPPPSVQFTGVLSWKGDNSRNGLNSSETTL